jgi:SAM-dependent methyltransferase
MDRPSPAAPIFNRDIQELGGYRYTSLQKLSCRLSNERMSRAVREMLDLKGKDVLDLGCGDGTYTLELLDQGPRLVVGVDPAELAIQAARRRAQGRREVSFLVGTGAELVGRETFDVAILRGVLHHVAEPAAVVAVVRALAREAVVVEPNGANPVVKLIERLSPYHRRHGERSFPPARLDGWFGSRGGRISRRAFIGLVPIFCPDPLARLLKRLEPWAEGLGSAGRLVCAQYVLRVALSRERGRPDD